jgi:hypothetical protein
MVPTGEDTQEDQQLPQNDNHDNDHGEEENNKEEEEEGNQAEGEEDDDYTPWSDAKKDETFHNADEIKTFGDEAPVIPCSKIAGTKPPYMCPGCSNHTYSNNMITRFHVQ